MNTVGRLGLGVKQVRDEDKAGEFRVCVGDPESFFGAHVDVQLGIDAGRRG